MLQQLAHTLLLEQNTRYLVMILHELHDDAYFRGVVFDGNDAHNICRVLRVGIRTVFIRQHQARVRVFYLKSVHGIIGICKIERSFFGSHGHA